MSNAPDQVRKRAIKRLMLDQKELEDSPVDNVSAVPLDDNMFEWHCNFKVDDTIFHLILFLPKNYPYDSPSAEFVPKGYSFPGGATMDGKKGVKACLSIFSDYAFIHKEWAKEKGMGWCPGYTIQTVLLNLISFLAETQDTTNSYVTEIFKKNTKLAKGFKCKDCGHSHSKPFPPLGDSAKSKKSKEAGENFQIVDYISKVAFNPKCNPKSKEELFGYGLVTSGPATRPSLTTPCEFLTGESFYGMKKSMGHVHSMLKDELAVFLPMYLTAGHGTQIQSEFENCLTALKEILPSCKRATIPEMVIKTIPNLMCATVVEFSKGTQHTSDNHLNGYFALHRLFLWAIETYPELQQMIDNRLEEFINKEEKRTKSACHHIGEWLMLLSVSGKYKWKDASKAYLAESWRRQVMWYVKDDASLGFLDTAKNVRLAKTLEATKVSRKLLSFQVLFLDIAMPPNMTRKQIIDRYDKTMGFPSPEMVVEMKQAVKKIDGMKTYEDWFKVLKLDPPSEDEIFQLLLDSVEYSINTNGYKWTFFKNQGGWAAVLKKYPKGTPGWIGKAGGSSKGGKGKGKGKKSDDAEEDTEGAKGKGKGKSKAAKEEPMEVEESPKASKGRGRGAKRKNPEPLVEEEVKTNKPGKKSTAGRGGKKVKFEEEEELPSKKGAAKLGAARGRGRGRK